MEADLTSVADDVDRLVRRLRSLSPRAWQDRREPARVALAGLVALSAQLEGRELLPPEVPDHVLPDAIAVVAGDVLDRVAREGPVTTAEVKRLIEDALVGTR